MRGMLAPPNSVAGQMLRRKHPTLPTSFFFQCVTEAIEAIEEAVPDALAHLDIGVEDVPDVSALWSRHMPLAASVDGHGQKLPHIIIYRRPIELRASDKEQLRQLIFVALVEQVSVTTGLPVSALDPTNIRGD